MIKSFYNNISEIFLQKNRNEQLALDQELSPQTSLTHHIFIVLLYSTTTAFSIHCAHLHPGPWDPLQYFIELIILSSLFRHSLTGPFCYKTKTNGTIFMWIKQNQHRILSCYQQIELEETCLPVTKSIKIYLFSPLEYIFV